MNVASPEKLVDCHCVNRDRNEKKSQLRGQKLARAVAQQQEKHPWQKDHGVAVGKLPAARIAVAPKNEGQKPNRDPGRSSENSAFSKK